MSTAPDGTPAAPAPAKASNPIALIALILAVLGFLLAVIPATAWIAWLVIIPAIVLAIIGLTRKGKPKGLAIAAIVVAPVAWLVAIIVAVAGFASGVGDALEGAGNPPSAGSEPDAPSEDGAEEAEEESVEAGIGDPVTNDDGVTFTVTAVTCGIDEAGLEYFEERAKGQFCRIDYTLDNGGTEEITISGSELTAYIGAAKYDFSETFIDGEYSFLESVNPGLSIEVETFVDIPVDATIEYLEFAPLFSFSEPVVIRLS